MNLNIVFFSNFFYEGATFLRWNYTVCAKVTFGEFEGKLKEIKNNKGHIKTECYFELVQTIGSHFLLMCQGALKESR